MNGGHTPGPWRAEPSKYEVDQWLVRIGPPSNRIIAYFGDRDQLEEEDVANARLIASAPELLEALLTKRDYVADAASGHLTYPDSGEGFIAMAKEDLARIDAAIAKARGEA